MFVDGYVVDGHVPVKCDSEASVGAARDRRDHLQGMPNGSPGMTGRKEGPFTIYAVNKDGKSPAIYAVE